MCKNFCRDTLNWNNLWLNVLKYHWKQPLMDPSKEYLKFIQATMAFRERIWRNAFSYSSWIIVVIVTSSYITLHGQPCVSSITKSMTSIDNKLINLNSIENIAFILCFALGETIDLGDNFWVINWNPKYRSSYIEIMKFVQQIAVHQCRFLALYHYVPA